MDLFGRVFSFSDVKNTEAKPTFERAAYAYFIYLHAFVAGLRGKDIPLEKYTGLRDATSIQDMRDDHAAGVKIAKRVSRRLAKRWASRLERQDRKLERQAKDYQRRVRATRCEGDEALPHDRRAGGRAAPQGLIAARVFVATFRTGNGPARSGRWSARGGPGPFVYQEASMDYIEEQAIVYRTEFSPEYHTNEAMIVRQTAVVQRIREDRRLNGKNDPEREIAYARAIGALHGYHFRDGELYHEETGIPIPRKADRSPALAYLERPLDES